MRGAILRWLAVLILGVLPSAAGADEPAWVRQEDLIYGRKFGTALTLDWFQPRGPANGAAVLLIVSGGWFSAHEAINPQFVEELIRAGYQVFAVVHGSQPKYTIPECIADVARATRYVRSRASDFGFDPQRMAIVGGSAGGHLSLMQGLAGDVGNAEAKDPIERVSSRVQVVACFFPPTDFLNFGEPGAVALGRGVLAGFRAPFDFEELNTTINSYERITDEAKILEIGRQISPIEHVSPDDPPILILHGDADKLVPIQQAQILVEKLAQAGVQSRLITKPGAAHGWPGLIDDMQVIRQWFDEHLMPAGEAATE